MEIQVMDQYLVVLVISIFKINQIQILEATVISVFHTTTEIEVYQIILKTIKLKIKLKTIKKKFLL
jgi:hypothetical protein